MTMKVTGRKASLYATAMAISLVALSGTAHAQSASNGRFKASALPTAEAAGGVKTAAVTNTKATLTAAQIDALAVSALKKTELNARNTVSAQLSSAISAGTKAAFADAAAAATSVASSTSAAQVAQARLDGTLAGLATSHAGTGTGAVAGFKIASSTASTATFTYLTNNAADIGKIAVAATSTTKEILYQGTATAVKAAAEARANSAFNSRVTASAETSAATINLASKKDLLAIELARTTVVPADVVTAQAAVDAAQQRLNLATARQSSVDLELASAQASLAASQTAFQTATTTKLTSDSAASLATATKSTADATLSTTLAADSGLALALTAVKAGTIELLKANAVDGLVVGSIASSDQVAYANAVSGATSGAGLMVAGSAITQAMIDAVKTGAASIALPTDSASVAQIALFGKYGVTLAATGNTASGAAAAAASAYKFFTDVNGLDRNFASLGLIETLDDQSLAGVPTLYASNGYTRNTTALAAAAASSNANIAMASAALTDGAAALEAGAAFETEVLSALVNIDGRTTANTTAITANTTAIAALDVRTTANATAITALDVRTTANTTAIANEVTARIAADNALGARITAETKERIAADNVLRDQIASSTATAIAMGGAALLPDMGFTLSGNVAFYEGAQAMALNAAGKVGANAFVTASVGGALNKNGSVGGRVGFVLGF